MVYLVQRIIVNSYGWTKPSPNRLGALGETEYVRKNGFGHEDWNFNFDLAIRGYVYGYAYYGPSPDKANDHFSIAFATYTNHRWRLVGFYLNAEFVPGGSPSTGQVLRSKMRDLMALKSANSLGEPWGSLDAEGLVEGLKRDTDCLRWKVHIKNVMRLPQPVAIPKRMFNSNNYRTTRPTEVSADTFRQLRTLASQTALPEDDDEAAFPEGRELLLMHKARERNPRVIETAKASFLRKHGKFCGFRAKANGIPGEREKGSGVKTNTIPG